MAGQERAHWGSRISFVLAAAGSAVGLGNIWRFPYIAGDEGGGLFVITYLACVLLIALPIMMSEILVGRTAQNSPVGAFRTLSRPGSPWMGVGWLGVITAFLLLSFYSVVAGWSMHYVWLSLTEGFAEMGPDEIGQSFEQLRQSPGLVTMWHALFMAMTIAIVLAGVEEGIEAWVRLLMPALLGILLILLFYAMTTSGFGKGVAFVFKPDIDKYDAGSALQALGQSFFTLSLGMGAIITYGSYLRRDDDLISTSILVAIVDTGVAVLGAVVVFPLLFSVGMDPGQGPGLVFVSLPIAFSKMAGGLVLAPIFFLLLTFAALTSAISLMEVATSYFVDERSWPRPKAAIATGVTIFLLGIPAAMSSHSPLFHEGMKSATAYVFGEESGKSWFGLADYLVGNWMLPLGGLGIALFAAWRLGDATRRDSFKAGSKLGAIYRLWLLLLRYLVPIGVVVILLNKLGVFDWLMSAIGGSG